MNDDTKKRELLTDHRTETDFIRNVKSALGYSEKVLDAWNSKFSILPDVDSKGNSSCSFAERLYAYKEEKEADIVKQIEELRKHDYALVREMGQVRRNMSVIASGAGRIHADPTKDEYEKARGAQEFAYNKLAEKREDIRKMIAKLEEALRLSRTKKWPLGKPRDGGGARGGCALACGEGRVHARRQAGQ